MRQDRNLQFGRVAEEYERFRDGYPAEVVDRVRAHATRPVRTALEIGAGTGKATRLFTAAGVHVTALEPDPAMLAVLTREVRDGVTPLLGTLEDAEIGGPFDLVFAAAALHWTDPSTRWRTIARVLSPGGVFASFGGPRELADDDLSERVREARSEIVPDDAVPRPDGLPDDPPSDDTEDLQWPGTELVSQEDFEDVRQVVWPRRSTLSADHYVGHLSTVSAYLVLTPADRTEVLRRIRAVLPDDVEIASDVVLHLARRTTPA